MNVRAEAKRLNLSNSEAAKTLPGAEFMAWGKRANLQRQGERNKEYAWRSSATGRALLRMPLLGLVTSSCSPGKRRWEIKLIVLRRKQRRTGPPPKATTFGLRHLWPRCQRICTT